MLPDPLHPAVVHFPIVFAVLLPLAAIGAIWGIRRGASPRLAWAIPVALAAGLSASAWAAVETGEDQEERVERVVPESSMKAHEEAAEQFLLLSLGVLGIAAAGLAKGRVGSAARATSVAAALGLMFAGYRVGHSGGTLVYRDGAAAAYATAVGGAEAPGRVGEEGDNNDDDDR